MIGNAVRVALGVVVLLVGLLGVQAMGACVKVADISEIKPGMHVCALKVTGSLDLSVIDLSYVILDSVKATGPIQFGDTERLTILGAVKTPSNVTFGVTNGFKGSEINGSSIHFKEPLNDCEFGSATSQREIEFHGSVVGCSFGQIVAKSNKYGDVVILKDVNDSSIGIISPAAALKWPRAVCPGWSERSSNRLRAYYVGNRAS